MNKVLLAEDDRTLQDVLRFNLVGEGYTVYQAFTGTEALSRAREFYPDLILLDMHAGGMSIFKEIQCSRSCW